MSWTVDEALDEVAAAIVSGAEPLVIKPQTLESLKALFVEDFRKRKSEGSRWPQDKRRVLPLANRIGKRAKLLMLDRLALHPEGEQEIEYVDSEIAKRAAYLVCKTYQSAGRTAGPYCTGIPLPPGTAKSDALHSLLKRIRKSGSEV